MNKTALQELLLFSLKAGPTVLRAKVIRLTLALLLKFWFFDETLEELNELSVMSLELL